MSSYAETTISAKESVKDITDEELTELEILVEGVKAKLKMENTGAHEGAIIIRVIDRLEELRQKYPSSPKTDMLLFLSGKAKTLFGYLAGDVSSPQSQAKSYLEKHRNWYDFPYMATVYNGEDYKKLIKDYPKSSLIDDAAFEIAMSQTMGGECESDFDCRIHRLLNPLVPFMKKYPASRKVYTALNEINDTFELMLHPEGGRWDILDMRGTGRLLAEYYDALMTLTNDMKISFNYRDAQYKLARAFISIGQYERAKKLYDELQSKYPNYYSMKKVAHLMLDYDRNSQDASTISPAVNQYLNQLKSDSEEKRLQALDKIRQESIHDKVLLLSILFEVADWVAKDKSPKVRRHALETIEKLAPHSPFFSSAVGYCLLYDSDKQNRYHCATLGKTHKDLKAEDFYIFNKDVIDRIETEITGQLPKTVEPTPEEYMERMRKDLELAEEIMKRAEELGLVERPKINWKKVVFAYVIIMLLCSVFCYRIAQGRGANKYLWAFLGAITAPISLLFVFIIPKVNKK